MKYIDIHSHPLKIYYEDPVKEITTWFEGGLAAILITATTPDEFLEVSGLVEKFERAWGVYGIHPNNATGDQDATFLSAHLGNKAVAVGEIGLDFHYQDSPSKEIQIESFVNQIDVARNLKLPVVIHCRDAFKELWEIISQPKFDDIKFVFHTFAEGPEEAKLVCQKPNMWISVSGVVTFKNALKTQEMVKTVPLEKLFAETDSPYLTPIPYRGSINSSLHVKYVYKKIAELKGVSEKDVIKKISENFKEVFGLDC